MPSPKLGRASSKISLEEALEGTLKIGLSKGVKGKMKLLYEAMVRRWRWLEACLIHGHLSLRGWEIKAGDCMEKQRVSGGNMSPEKTSKLKP